MDFIATDQKWWCNACVAWREGSAPEGQAGPTAADTAAGRARRAGVAHQQGHRAWQGVSALATILQLGAVVTGGLLMATGHPIVGGVVLAVGLLSWLGMSLL